ncbi:MAG: metallophosphoesterase, partial [Chloroflexota bacterium]|nr:metallophosphoesterase [Chloroflexota bacterium]
RLLIMLLPVLLGGYATLREPYRPIFKRHRLKLASNWPALSVVHISDLHVRRADQRLYRAQRAALAGLAPDLVCVTGDVCEKVEDIELVIELLRAARPRLGTFIVLGNHEHNAPLPDELRREHRRGWRCLVKVLLHILAPQQRSAGAEEGHAMAEALASAGFTVLHNAGTRVEDAGRSLWIAGCDSAWAGHADMLAAMAGRRPGEACLALIHEPDLAFEAHEQGADLILAGHTHGGQVRLPVVGAPYTLRTDPRISIAAGFQRIGAGLLHITAGLGHTIPLRFLCPPEVVWLDCMAD